MKKYINSFPLLFAILFFVTCDHVDDPQPEPIRADTSTGTSVRKILVEDYTGHHCGNCPRAHHYIDSLIKYHGKRIIAIGVHVGKIPCGANAALCPPDYVSDYRTTTGNDYAAQFSIGSALPTVLLNRVGYSSSDPTLMQFDIVKLGNNYSLDTILNKPHIADIKITNTYTSSSRSLTCDIETTFLKDTSGTYNIVVLIAQDSLVSYQKDYDLIPNEDVSNYTHRHVLRDAVTSSWGDVLASGDIDSSTTFPKTYSYAFPGNDMYLNTPSVPLNSSVIVYIYKVGTYEVIQAETEEVK